MQLTYDRIKELSEAKGPGMIITLSRGDDDKLIVEKTIPSNIDHPEMEEATMDLAKTSQPEWLFIKIL